MRLSFGKALFIVAILGAPVIAVSYVSGSGELNDVKLVSIEAVRFKDVAELQPAGEAAPETPVFKVRFSSASDLVRLANGLDAYSVRNRVLVGDAGCNPGLKVLTYASVADMLIDFTPVFDGGGNIENRGLWSSSTAAGSNGHVYHFYFGVDPMRMTEFLATGLQEAPICFALTGDSRTGRQLSSNIEVLPPRLVGQAATRLVGFLGRNPL